MCSFEMVLSTGERRPRSRKCFTSQKKSLRVEGCSCTAGCHCLRWTMRAQLGGGLRYISGNKCRANWGDLSKLRLRTHKHSCTHRRIRSGRLTAHLGSQTTKIPHITRQPIVPNICVVPNIPRHPMSNGLSSFNRYFEMDNVVLWNWHNTIQFFIRYSIEWFCFD